MKSFSTDEIQQRNATKTDRPNIFFRNFIADTTELWTPYNKGFLYQIPRYCIRYCAIAALRYCSLLQIRVNEPGLTAVLIRKAV